MTTTETTTGAQIRMEGVTKTYEVGSSKVHALNGVDLVIPAGQFVVILGPSGSGKTTLLNVIGAIDDPTSGSLIAADKQLAELGEDERTAYRRKTVGFVFQFFNLIPTLTARENVELIAELTGDDGATRATEALGWVGLEDRMDHFPSQLSGGEQQRVAIARALAKHPPLLLCDEPTGELDFETGRNILGLIRRLNREQGQTVLLVTHNAAIGETADRVLRLHSGEIVDDRLIDSPIPAEALEW
jgi:putative ABC transport system ATP-binding protein